MIKKIEKPKWLKGVNKVKKKNKSELKRKELEKWIKRYLNYNKNDNAYFITIRYATEYKPTNYETARNIFRKIIRNVYDEIYGKKWLNHIPKSICIIEKGKRRYLHSHLIINSIDLEPEHLLMAFDKIQRKCWKLNFDFTYWETPEERDTHSSQSYCPKKNDIAIEPIGHSQKDMNRIIKYITKEYNLDRKKIDFSNFIPEDIFFRAN